MLIEVVDERVGHIKRLNHKHLFLLKQIKRSLLHRVSFPWIRKTKPAANLHRLRRSRCIGTVFASSPLRDPANGFPTLLLRCAPVLLGTGTVHPGEKRREQHQQQWPFFHGVVNNSDIRRSPKNRTQRLHVAPDQHDIHLSESGQEAIQVKPTQYLKPSLLLISRPAEG